VVRVRSLVVQPRSKQTSWCSCTSLSVWPQ